MRLVLALFIILIGTTAFALEKANLVVVSKSNKTLSLFKNSKLLASFPVVFGASPQGHKQQEGDEHTPEGRYTLDYKKANSSFYRAIHISYPNQIDKENAKRRGVDPGGAIMVHGQKNGLGWAYFISKHFNWTNGCIALSNKNMDLVWESVDAGTPIEIKP
ncbi:L,D-transpeptidase family protein [Trichlorobacter lovleyi]|uniref:L,D-transpeptidase family protein n=1 Tax=Trichlorobacter lovleyi TaxID=313985 RepID=UPI0023F551F6|nr:L,D-transpeptidase family protein [Trichlorobacter lovleyi]